jgi:hypothetical protein
VEREVSKPEIAHVGENMSNSNPNKKTDFRIVGKPYRCARRMMVMISGLTSQEKADKKLDEGIKGGWLDPFAYVRKQTVNLEFVGEDSTLDIQAEIKELDRAEAVERGLIEEERRPMLLQIIETYVDEDDANVHLYNVALTDEELNDIRRWAKGTTEWNDEEWVEFRSVRYIYPEDVNDILQDVGTVVVPDETIATYVY